MPEYAREVARPGQPGGGSSHYSCTAAASAVARCKISAVSEDQSSGDCVSLRDFPTAVGN
jgi:hypothetical protein